MADTDVLPPTNVSPPILDETPHPSVVSEPVVPQDSPRTSEREDPVLPTPTPPPSPPSRRAKEKTYDDNGSAPEPVYWAVPTSPVRPLNRLKKTKNNEQGLAHKVAGYVISDKTWPFFCGVVACLTVLFIHMSYGKSDGMHPVPASGTPEWRDEMITGGLSTAYINADSAAVDLYHQKRQLSHHPIDHISYILPPDTPWNVKKYFMDRIGTSIISGEESLADAEIKGFYNKKSASFVIDRYSPSIRNVIPSLLNMSRVVEEIARHRHKYSVSDNLFGCVSSHTLGITAKFVVLRVSEKKLAVKRDPRTPIALDYLEKVANSTRMTFPDIDPKGVYFFILDGQILPETDDMNILLASKPGREKPVNYKDILGNPSTSNYKSVKFLIENRINGSAPALKYNFEDDYVSFTAPGEVAIRYLNMKTGIYENVVIKGGLIGCIEKSQRYANAKGFDTNRLVTKEYLEGKMEESGSRRRTPTAEQLAADEKKRQAVEQMARELEEIKARIAAASAPVQQPQYNYDDISDEEEEEFAASDATYAAVTSALGGSAGNGQRHNPGSVPPARRSP